MWPSPFSNIITSSPGIREVKGWTPSQGTVQSLRFQFFEFTSNTTRHVDVSWCIFSYISLLWPIRNKLLCINFTFRKSFTGCMQVYYLLSIKEPNPTIFVSIARKCANRLGWWVILPSSHAFHFSCWLQLLLRSWLRWASPAGSRQPSPPWPAVGG